MQQSERLIDILFVEDDPTDIRLFREALADLTEWCKVTTAKNGAEALDMLFQRGKYRQQKLPDLILLDLNLPILSGHEVLTALKANNPLNLIPVVVLTTSQRPEDVRRAYDLGAASYVIKPHNLEDFIGICRSLYEYWYKRVTLPSAQAASAN